MAVKPPYPMKIRGTGRRGEVLITGTITIGASGAVSSFACEFCPSNGIVKNAAAGRYDIVFARKYKNLRTLSCSITGPASAAFGNTDGNAVQFRPATSTFHATLQVFLASSGVDTNTTSGNVINFTIVGQDL